MTDDTDIPPPAGKKATNAVVAMRVEVVLRLRIDGATFADIRDYANHPDRNWQVSDSQLKRYIQRSDELLRERTEKGRGKATRLHLARREALYARALKDADLRTALSVLDSDAKLRGLFDDPAKLKQEALDLLAKVTALEAAARDDRPAQPGPAEQRGADPDGRPEGEGAGGEPAPPPPA